MGQYEVLWAGFGGQGIMVAGQLLAYTGIKEGKNVVWLPSYGPEMRGGTAYCTVVISDARIGSPIISSPRAAVVFNRPSFDKFSPRIKAGGLLIVNSSLIDVTTERTDITEILVPANRMALDAGSPKATNIAMLSAFVGATGVVKYENLLAVLEEKLGSKKDLLDINRAVMKAGYELGQKAAKSAPGKKVKA
ncbi:MAG: 2-oxoacid:acceptor oxidoreductase family protein [candidate division Zixibacteria bacterium]|jgi:2-oxoglutarate ferredoxin oxidoreductase subunit gamma|nr:2-oxoacid:acceptor oxidoreductase family protein [candidate division Zixibacteria bacterium]